MEREFKKLSSLARKRLTEEELGKYLDALNEYYFQKRKHTFEEDLPIKDMKLRKELYSFLRQLLVAQRTLKGQKLEVLSDERKGIDSPKIYAMTHIGKYDIEMAMEALKDHTYVLLGDAKYMYQTIDDLFLRLIGVIYVDVYNAEDRYIAKETAIKVLQQGGNVLWCPEGIWNITENQIVLPCSYGIIEAAIRSKAHIVPVAIEQRGKDFYMKIGSEVTVEEYQNVPNDKLIAIRELRENLATLRWQIWENFGSVSRREIPDNYHDEFVTARIKEWPHFTQEEIESRIFRPPGIVTEKEVFGPLEKLEYGHNNAFLLKKLPKVKRL
jgi:hypothetical protein